MSVKNRNHTISLTDKEAAQVENILSEYPFFTLMEKRRRQEIAEEKERDENIGGGRSSSASNHGHENIVLRYSEDEIINRIVTNKKVIDDALEKLDPYQQTIIKLSYFQRFNKPSAERIAEVAKVGRTTVFRFRSQFITYIYPRIEI